MDKNKVAQQLVLLAKSLIAFGAQKRYKDWGGGITVTVRFSISIDNQTPDFVKGLFHRSSEEIIMHMKALEKVLNNDENDGLCKFSFNAHQIRINGGDSEFIIISGTSPIEYGDKEKTPKIISILQSQGFKG